MRKILQKLPMPRREIQASRGGATWPSGQLQSAGAIMLVMGAWLWVCHLLKFSNHYNMITAVTGLAFLVIASLVMDMCAQELTKKIRWVLIALLVVKMIGSVAYFAHFFVIRDGVDVSIAAYGDSPLHHRAAIEFLERWAKYGIELGLNPNSPTGYEPSYVTSLGYAGLLALIYAGVGIVPEAGIVVNTFLAFVFCLLAYRLFAFAGLPSRTALVGLAILFFCPALWLWSALLYKESLLFLVIAASSLAAIKLIAEFSWRLLLLNVILLVLLLILRFSFVVPLLAMLLFGPFYLSKAPIRKKLITLLAGCVVLMALLVLQGNYNLINSTTSIMDTVKAVMNLKPSGGSFMTSGIGSIPPDITNFWYTLPARAAYILMIPMPWFGGATAVERFDYIISHLDAVYDITLFMALFIMLVQQRHIVPTKVQNMLLMVGLIYFLIPLFFFFPSRRYFTIAIPFLLAYALPVLTQRKYAIASVAMAGIFISIVQIAYYARYS